MVCTRLFPRVISTCVLLVGCVNTALLVAHDEAPPKDAWAVVGLTLAGSEADNSKRQECIELAREQGVHVSRYAPPSVQATLLLTYYDGNRVSFADGRPERAIGQLAMQSACIFALAAALRLEEKIQSSQEAPPPNCRLLGEVKGPSPTAHDFTKQSYELGLAPMLLAAQRLRANYITLDVLYPFGAHVPMVGRAFACPPSTAGPSSSPAGSTSPPAVAAPAAQ